MNLQAVLNSRKAAAALSLVCRYIPPGLAGKLTKVIARSIASKTTLPEVQAVRANQWVIHGETSTCQALDDVALACWESIVYGFYELFHWSYRPQAMLQRVDFSAVEEIIQRSREGRHGQVICGLHFASFDFALQAAVWQGLKAHIFSAPVTNEVVAWQHEMRRRTGVEIVYPDLAHIRQSIRRLEQGESLVTAIDYPVSDGKYALRFWDRPARLPVHHVSLALQSHALLVLLAPVRRPDGKIHFFVSEEMRLKQYPDHQQTMVINAEQILETARILIQKAPTQWAETHPVWPESLGLMPIA